VSRIPIRLRLTLGFALAMALVLGALAVLLYVRLGHTLDEQIEQTLQLRADTLAALVRERGGSPNDAALASTEDDVFAQLLTPDGAIVASSPSVPRHPLVVGSEFARARSATLFAERDTGAARPEPVRLLATPVDGSGVLVVGTSLEERDEALDGLLAELFVLMPIALVLASLAGYGLTAAALRPVEAMRRRAEGISAERSGERLPVPAARDELRRLGETLNDMLGRLDEGLARERRFVADASHELRTPLANLRAELDLARRRPRTPDDLEAALRSASEEVDRLARLAEDLLVLARLDEGRLPLREEPLDTEELLDTVARRFDARAREAGRRLEADGGRGGTVVGDRLRLEQALGNLVDNALRHGSGAVRLDAESAKGSVELRVTDEGRGFPSGFATHAVERFRQPDEARSGPSAGLGLAITDAIARAHGGELRLTNGAGAGAVVALALPARS
jgi:two-component system, OmpR family, sensor kinase